MKSRSVLVFLAVICVLAFGSKAAWAQEQVPLPLQEVGIEDRPGAEVPLDVPFVNQDGREVTLAHYLSDGKPLVIVPAYFQCPMLCSLVLNGLQKALGQLAWSAGKEFNLVTLSFDPRDNTELATKMRDDHLKTYGRPVGDKGWDFLVGEEEYIRKVTDAIGFFYRWEEKQQEYAHASGAFVVTPDGRLSRTLYGIEFPQRDMRLALTEASAGKLGSSVERVLLFCFHYDANAYGYVLATRRLMSAAGALTIIVLAFFLFRYWRSDNRRPERPEEAHT